MILELLHKKLPYVAVAKEKHFLCFSTNFKKGVDNIFFLCIINFINLVKPLEFFKTEGGGDSGESLFRVPKVQGSNFLG